MRFRFLTIVLVLTAAIGLAVEPSGAFDFFSSRQRSRNQCCLPNHDYDRAVWPFTQPYAFGETAIAVAATDPTNEDRKPFHFRAIALTVDHITLDQVGLAIYQSRYPWIVATGRITHSGGDGGLIGNNVTIRVRAYVKHVTTAAPLVQLLPATPPQPPVLTSSVMQSGDSILNGSGNAAGTSPSAASPTTPVEVLPLATPNEVLRIPPDAFVVWESEHKLWVARGRPQHISLVNPSMSNYAGLVNFFDEITHLEVELEYRRDR